MAQANPVRATVSILGKIPPLPRISKWYRRTPFGRSEPKVWRRPDDEAEYQRLLHDDGFISPMYWEDDDLTKYPPIMQDLDDLEEYLLPAFLEYNQKARHYQMSYYFYQWIFIVGAFLTTVMGVLTTYFAGDRVMFLGTQYETVRLLGWETGWSMVGMFSVMTTIVSAITSYFTLLSNQGEPRKRWASYRRLAEELRMLYFKFLSRLDPYDKPNRVEVLRRRVIEIREQEHSSA